MADLTFLLRGSIEQVAGSYVFDRRVVEGLRSAGRPVAVVDAMEPGALARLPDGAVVVLEDGALAPLARGLAVETRRLRIVAFVHHLPSDETGIGGGEARKLAALEAAVLPGLRGVICPSARVAGALAACGVAPERIAVTPPGTDKPASQRVRCGPVRRLVCVANVIPRKGHAVLVEALAQLAERDWRLDCLGSLTRDPGCAAALRAQIAAAGLAGRIALAGEQGPASVAAAYRAADAFVLASFHEGFGMAFAEAMASGLPIVATTAGAIPETVPETAGLLVPPGDAAALAAALRGLMDDPAAARRLSEGALAAAAMLPDWPSAVALWTRALDDLSRRDPPAGCRLPVETLAVEAGDEADRRRE